LRQSLEGNRKLTKTIDYLTDSRQLSTTVLTHDSRSNHKQRTLNCCLKLISSIYRTTLVVLWIFNFYCALCTRMHIDWWTNYRYFPITLHSVRTL